MELLETGMKEIVNPVPDVRAYNVVDLTSWFRTKRLLDIRKLLAGN